MSSDYEFSDNDDEYSDGDDMMGEDNDSTSEMDMDYDDFKAHTKGKKKAYLVDHTSLSQESVEQLMKAEIEHISGIFGVDIDTTALLLRHLSWNKERLIEKYMDNSTAVSVAAGVILPEPAEATGRTSSRRTRSSPISKSSRSQHKPAPFVCAICFDDSPSLQTRHLSCDHVFCIGCWSAYLTSKISDEGEHSIRCMAEGCTVVSPDSFIHSVLLSPDADQPEAGPSTWSRFQQLTLRDFVSANKHLKYCPYPSCTNTVSCPSASNKRSLSTVVPTVSCGARGLPLSDEVDLPPDDFYVEEKRGKEHVFCFGCPIESDHRPCVCTVAKLWLKKCHDDSETANWIKSNTKECPMCNSTIEKNGGCNHMTCKKCKHEFCWVCMGPWSDHGTSWYSCNRYEGKAGEDAQSRSRASLERYLHYYNRWANHEQSAKLSVTLYRNTEKKMEDIQITSSLTWIEVQFMKKAVDEVVKCRATLQWTYAMAYYLGTGNQKELFEDNQRDLERAVEDLSELLESQIDAETIPTLRQKVTDKTVYVQNRNEVVLEDTANGLLEGRWKWDQPIDGFADD